MQYAIKTTQPEKYDGACVVVTVSGDKSSGLTLSPSAKSLDTNSKGALSTLLKRGDLKPKLGQSLLLQYIPELPCQRILLIHTGAEKTLSPFAFRRILAKISSVLKLGQSKNALLCHLSIPVKDRTEAWKIQQTVEIFESAFYTYHETKTTKKLVRALEEVNFYQPNKNSHKANQAAIDQGLAIATGMNTMKNLANLPANICTPSYLAQEAEKLAKKHGKIKTTVLDEAQMKKLGMNALLAVAKGSDQPPKLITIEYNGGSKTQAPIVLVGKGITFDSGGISLKPPERMDEMKFDMSGAACVIGLITAIAQFNLKLNVTGLIASAENLVNGHATKPGDIVKTMSGKTVEILNTDAEGRLILCDALTYCERFKPKLVIDMATLTGACVIALGNEASGLMSNDQSLADELFKAGQQSCDRAWQLPLWDEYLRPLKSNFADMANIGNGTAGTITAGIYLSKFTKKYTWAHLDIAGTAYRSGPLKGSTGRPVPLMMHYLFKMAGI